MNLNLNHKLVFLFGCMTFRFFLTYISKTKLNLLPIMGTIALIPAIGFMIIYVFKLRTTGIEVNGNPIWWNNLRPIHSLLFFLFSYLAINKNKNSWVVLLIDTLLGLTSFLKHYHYV